MKEKRVVLIQGAFDIINYGHVRAFKFAKSKGDYLIVALNTNRLIKQYKKRDAVVPWWQKKAIIESFKYVDKVIRADEASPLNLLKKHKVKVYVISQEWYNTKSKEITYMRKIKGRVCISRRFNGISTSAIKYKLLKELLYGKK